MGGQSRVLIMSLRSGAGLDGLQDWCSAAVFGELDWSPEVHRQCVGRLARDGQESTVVAYYMVSDDGTDPLMAEVLGIKKQQAEPIRDPDAPLFSAPATATDRARALASSVLERVRKRKAIR
jgi:SNF2 family DNA or RNA helicase